MTLRLFSWIYLSSSCSSKSCLYCCRLSSNSSDVARNCFFSKSLSSCSLLSNYWLKCITIWHNNISYRSSQERQFFLNLFEYELKNREELFGVTDGKEHADERQEHHDRIVDEGVVLTKPDVVIHEEHEDYPEVPGDLWEMGLFLYLLFTLPCSLRIFRIVPSSSLMLRL